MKTKILDVLLHIVVYVVVMIITAVITFQLYFSHFISELFAPLQTEWNDQVGTVMRDLNYSEGEFHNYDLYLPADKTAHSLILFIHGGGFNSGDKADQEIWCKYFTSKGYITASANYSLAGKATKADLNIMYDELLQCVRNIKKECFNLGVEVSCMATSGQSAGGCLALLYAYRAGEDSPIPVKMVFQHTGPVDFAPEGWGSATDEAKAEFVQMMTGKEVTLEDVHSGKYLDMAAEVSPASLVDSLTVPTLSAYGPHDKIVPVALKFKLFEKLDKYGVPNEYIEFPHSGHAMAGDPDKHVVFLQKALEYCQKYLE